MRRIARSFALVPLMLAITGSASAAPRHHKVPPKCSSGSSAFRSVAQPYRQQLTADTQAQVYSLAASAPGPRQPENSALPQTWQPEIRVYGCAYGHRGAYALGHVAHFQTTSKYLNESFSGIALEVLAGPIVAYEEVANQLGCGGCHWGVVVRDLRTGRTLRREPTGTPVSFDLNYGVGPTTAIVVKSNGSVAWIANVSLEGGGYQVHAADTAGNRLLASGPGIDPMSLALAGSTLYWTQGGKPFSAPLE
jgi:hypothetical protein